MPKFTLHWKGTKKSEVVEGDDIAQAVTLAGYGGNIAAALDYYDNGDTTVQVAGQAGCGCVHHAEEGLSCRHDLALIGLNEK